MCEEFYTHCLACNRHGTNSICGYDDEARGGGRFTSVIFWVQRCVLHTCLLLDLYWKHSLETSIRRQPVLYSDVINCTIPLINEWRKVLHPDIFCMYDWTFHINKTLFNLVISWRMSLNSSFTLNSSIMCHKPCAFIKIKGLLFFSKSTETCCLLFFLTSPSQAQSKSRDSACILYINESNICWASRMN